MDKVKRPVDGGLAHWTLELERRLSFLNGREITMIDDLLKSVAPFGEVRLAVQKGRLRYVSSVTSHDALQLTGGASADRREG
jgi:hypothetical protein